MKKIFIALFISALLISTSVLAEWQGNGFKIIGHTSFVSPNVKNSWIKEVDTSDLLTSPFVSVATVSSRDVYTRVHEYADLISNHQIFITNSSSQSQVYRIQLFLSCGVGIRDEAFYVQLNPGGKLTNQYQMAMAEEVDTPGTYDIKVFTKIEGVESNYMELHYKFYARQ